MIPARRSSSPRLVHHVAASPARRTSLVRRALVALLGSPRLLTAAWIGSMIFLVFDPCWPALEQAPANGAVQIAPTA